MSPLKPEAPTAGEFDVETRVDAQPRTFAWQQRFEVVRRLGEGAMGVVYQVHDRVRGSRVALKTVQRLDANALYRLKHEFRSLADVTHTNLIALHELLSIEEQWFFTMELVEGTDFLSYVRPSGAQLEDDWTAVRSFEPNAVGAPLSQRPRAAPRKLTGRSKLSETRLRASLAQLVSGLMAIHDAGKLHRDIKPGNVLVTPEGRVVVLDFGLVADFATDRDYDETELAGTINYMSPEQAGRQPLTPASDFYSAGVMMYQALTGRRPYVGSADEVMQAKQTSDPPRPLDIAPALSPDLDALCVAMLLRAPDQRPHGRQILEQLAAQTSTPVYEARPSDLPEILSPVGRAQQLGELASAFEIARGGQGVTAFVHGRSGMGKSTLVQQFLTDAMQEPDAVVLQGRCYERESVPYKAVDSLVDELSRFLLMLEDADVESLAPADTGALLRLFPVLTRVPPLVTRMRRGREIPDRQEFRRRAFDALRFLLTQLARRTPLVLCIDDLQWGDLDSIALLTHVLAPPNPPPMLLVLAYRSEDSDRSAPLIALNRWRETAPMSCDIREIGVGELSHADARDLARTLLDEPDDPTGSVRADTIARESTGNPMLVYELVRYAQSHTQEFGSGSSRSPVTLAALLQTRFDGLAAEPRALLNVISVAAQPISHEIARLAAQLNADQYVPALTALRSARAIRTRGIAMSDEVETFHDRIRETVVSLIPAIGVAAMHHALATVLRESGDADPETLAVHFHAAGEDTLAGGYAAIAAERAADALAFDRAAQLYRVSLEWRGPLDPEAARPLRTALGDALANAGRGPDAAREYLAASDGAPPHEALELTRRSAEQWLRSGHVDEGLDAVRAVLDAVGFKLAETPARAVMSLLTRRASLKFRGLDFRERAQSQITTTELTRVDVCWSVAVGLGMIDTIRGADFNTRTLVLALDAGDPYRIVRSLALEVAFMATGGVGAIREVQNLLKVAKALVAKLEIPHAHGLVYFATGVAAFLRGDYVTARAETDRAGAIFREQCAGVAWEIASSELFGNMARFYLGEWAELAARVPIQLRDARGRSDLYAATNLRIGHSNAAWLSRDDVSGAISQADDAMLHWSQRGFHMEHFFELMAQVHADLYEGREEGPSERVNKAWPALSSTQLLRIQHLNLSAMILRASSALAEPTVNLRTVERDADRIEREGAPWSDAIALLFRAAVASRDRDPEEAVSILDRAISSFQTQSMGMYNAVAQRRLGELIGGRDGTERVRAADAWMRAQGVVKPANVAAMLGPGFSRAR